MVVCQGKSLAHFLFQATESFRNLFNGESSKIRWTDLRSNVIIDETKNI